MAEMNNNKDLLHVSSMKLQSIAINSPLQQLSDISVQSSSKVENDVKEYVEAAISENTRRAYTSDIQHFTAWGGSIPCSPDMVAAYLVNFAGSMAMATLRRRLASISKAHKLNNYPSPTASDIVQMTLKGISRVHGKPQRQAAALLKDELVVVLSTMSGDLRAIRDKALLLLGFCTAVRRSELCRVRYEDLNFSTEGLILNLPRSKTDQMGEGRLIAVPLGRGVICPVQAVIDWLKSSGIKEGCIFRAIEGGKPVTAGLCDRSISNIVKLRIRAAGFNESNYSGHSLRAGLATSAAQQGFSSWDIRRQTGHKSDAMLQRYIRNGGLFRNNASGLF